MFAHYYWIEDDIDFYFDLDETGQARRNVSIVRSSGSVQAAVDRTEWAKARDYGDLYRYMAKYGRLAEGDIGRSLFAGDRRDHLINSGQFDLAWNQARSVLEAIWDNGGSVAYEADRATGPEWVPLIGRHQDGAE